MLNVLFREGFHKFVSRTDLLRGCNTFISSHSSRVLEMVVKKSVKLNKITRHLEKQCSLLSWFSSVISVTRERLNGEENRVFLRHVSVILKVVNDVISFESMSKWLQNYGLEQLMELSSTLFHFLLHDVSTAKETAGLVNPFLQMIASMLKLSQKRKVYQPHFNFSIEGLYQIYQAGSVCNQPTENINPEFVLEAILMMHLRSPFSQWYFHSLTHSLHLFISIIEMLDC